MNDMSEVGGLLGWDFDLNEEWTWDQTVHDDTSSQTVHISFVPSSSNIGDNPSTVPMPTDDAETSRLEPSNPFLLKGLTTSDVVRKEFDPLEQVKSFYFNYAKVMGFSVRKDEVRHDDKGRIKLHRWVCNKQGYRPKIWLEKVDRVREPRAITREGCLASLRVNLQHDTRKWVVKEFVSEHSHQLASNYDTQFLRSHRNVKGSDVALAMSLRSVGVKTGQVMDFMVDQAGGYCNVGHTRKDLQNQIDATRRSIIVDSDAENAIAYFFAKTEADPGFFFKYTVDAENRLCNLFWSDSKSRDDFHFFGDVIAFDSTCRTNVYKKSFVIFVGTNHHWKTTVFGFGLLIDETVETYTWLLETFLLAMEGKKPMSVITDGDKAMRKALKKVMSESVHRLCCWHLERNAQSNIQDVNFTDQFKHFLLNDMSIEKFDSSWLNFIEKFNVKDNEWVVKMYKERELWAETFLRGYFFAGMQSTQHCESMNSYLHWFVNYKLKIYEFIHQIDRALARIRNIEAQDEFDSKNGQPVLSTHILLYEQHVAKVFSRYIFLMVRDEIKAEASLVMTECVQETERHVYQLTKFRNMHLT